MSGLKRLGLILLILLGPASFIYLIAKFFNNQFIDLPYLGKTTYVYNDNHEVVDSTLYTVPPFELQMVNGEKTITQNSIKHQFVILTTLQNSCPDTCGVYTFHFETIMYEVMKNTPSTYSNVKIISVLTDFYGNPVEPTDKFVEFSKEYDSNLWWICKGDPSPLFHFEYNGNQFDEMASDPDNNELGTKAFINSLVLIDKEGHYRGFSGARRDSDIRNMFDLLKVLKQKEYDDNRKSLQNKKN